MPDMHINAPATPTVQSSPGRRPATPPVIVAPAVPAAPAVAQPAPLRVVPPTQGMTEKSPHAPQKFYRPGPATAAPEAAPALRQPVLPPASRQIFETIPRTESGSNRGGDAEQHRRAFEAQRRSNLARSAPQEQRIEAAPVRGHERRMSAPASVIPQAAPQAVPPVKATASAPQAVPAAGPRPEMHHGGIGRNFRHEKDVAQPEAGQKTIEKGR